MKKMLGRALLMALAMLLIALCAAGAETSHIVENDAEVLLTGDKAIVMDLGKGVYLIPVDGDEERLELTGCASSREAVATVGPDGYVTAKKKGDTRITLETEQGTTYRVSVTVVNPGKPDKLFFTKKSITLYTGELDVDLDDLLRAKSGSTEYDFYDVTWKSSKKSVVTVNSEGDIKAKKPGSAIITATAKNKKKATIRIDVKKNRIDNIFPRPKMNKIGQNKYAIYLKSLEFTTDKTVVAEYYLLFTYPRRYTTTVFSYIDDRIYLVDPDDGEETTIVDGEVTNVSVSTQGQTVTVFKVTYKGSDVRNTDFRLKNEKGNITDKWDCYLNWRK